MTRLPYLCCFLAILPIRASAQSINIDFGESGDGPDSSYAAAGQAGFWNRIAAEHTTPDTAPQPFDYQLLDVHGLPTTVGLHQFGGMAWFSTDDPAVGGQDAELLEDGLITFNASLESCLYLNGLQPGTYEVTTYAWLPNQPSSTARVRVDNSPPPTNVGGAWPGAHQETVTYARHIVTVGPTGFMGPHSGVAAGSDPLIGAALNGMQLRLLCSSCFTKYCAGDGSGGVCPCLNSGAPGNGCGNSANASGAGLSAIGVSSLSNDTVRLQATGLVPNTTALFFQGDEVINAGEGVTFGDGLRCAGVNVLRLAIRSTGAGSVDFGSGVAGDPLISSAGMVPAAGANRAYQLWYRDPASFCTPAAWNLTNGVAVIWGL